MKLEFLIIHCTATKEGREVTAQEIIDWHTSPKPRGNGWSKVGYTDIIHLDGSITNLTPFDQDDEVDGYEITNGARGVNSISRHIVYAGGLDEHGESKDTKTAAQNVSLATYLKYMVLRHPDIKIAGHYQFSPKLCPGFDVEQFCEAISIPCKNIYFG